MTATTCTGGTARRERVIPSLSRSESRYNKRLANKRTRRAWKADR
jgi:hypothetical protein